MQRQNQFSDNYKKDVVCIIFPSSRQKAQVAHMMDATRMNGYSLGSFFSCNALLCDRWSSILGLADDDATTTGPEVPNDEKRVHVSWSVYPDDSAKPPRHSRPTATMPASLPSDRSTEMSRPHLPRMCRECHHRQDQCECRRVYMNMNLITPLGEEGAPMKSLSCSPVTCGGAPNCRGCSRCLQHCICKWTNKQTQGSDSSHHRASSLGSRGFRNNKLFRNTALRC